MRVRWHPRHLYIFLAKSPSQKWVVRGLFLPLEPLLRQAQLLALNSETVLQEQPAITPVCSAPSLFYLTLSPSYNNMGHISFRWGGEEEGNTDLTGKLQPSFYQPSSALQAFKGPVRAGAEQVTALLPGGILSPLPSAGWRIDWRSIPQDEGFLGDYLLSPSQWDAPCPSRPQDAPKLQEAHCTPLVPNSLWDSVGVAAALHSNMLCLCLMNVPNLGPTIFARARRKSGNLILACAWSQKYSTANGHMKDLAEIHPCYPKCHSEHSQRLLGSQ